VLILSVRTTYSELGVASVDMNQLLSAPAHRTADNRLLRAWDSYVPVHRLTSESSTAGSKVKQGSLRVILTLEDFGATGAEHRLMTASSSHAGGAVGSHHGLGYLTESTAAAAGAAAPEYQVSWELEAWRRAKQVEFEAQLRDTEAKRMRQLEDEFKRQELLREEQFAKKQAELNKLQTKLRDALFDVQKQVGHCLIQLCSRSM